MAAMALSHKGSPVVLARITDLEVHLEQRSRQEPPLLAINAGDVKILLGIGDDIDVNAVCDQLIDGIVQWRRDLTGV